MSNKRASAPTPKKDPKTGTWYFSFDSKHPRPDGSRRQIFRRGFATLAEAKGELKRLMAEDRPAGALTVEQVLDRFIAKTVKAGRAPNTVAGYRNAAKRAKEQWAGWDASLLLGEHLDDAYTEWLSSGKRKGGRNRETKATGEGLSPRSVEYIHKTVKAAYALELRRRDTPLRWNPADDATPPTVVVSEQRRSWWTPEQVGEFLEYDAEHDDLPIGMVDTLADTGGRRGETCAARWVDVDLDDLDDATLTVVQAFAVNNETNEIDVRPTKRPRDKATISLHRETARKLRLRRKQQAAERLAMGAGWPGTDDPSYDLIFTRPDGRMIRPDTLTRVIARMSVAAKLPRLTPHGLRHSFATAALKARVRVEVVAARLGNTVRVTQEIYTHAIPADDRAAAKTVGDLYRRPKARRKAE